MPRASELATLSTLAQALSRSAAVGDALDAALATVAELLGLETGWVWLLEEGAAEPRLAAARALPAALRDHPEAMRGDCYCLSTFRAGDLQGAANVSVVWCSRLAKLVDDGDAGATDGASVAAAGLRCHASVPLRVGERKLGMLNVASGDWRVLSRRELNLLTTAGVLVSLAVERARLEAATARAAAAEERNRLAREIHDTLAQSLAAITMQLEAADALADAAQGARGDGRGGAAADARLAHARLAGSVRRALALARSTLEDARRSVLDLRADPLGGRTLVEALGALAGEVAALAPRKLDVRVSRDELAGPWPDLPAAVEAGLYRITREALLNAARHAGATRVEVRLAREPGRVRLRVEDDGIGFDPAAVPPGRFGLVGMNERARLLGGALSLASAPGAGTAVDVVVPFAPSAPTLAPPGPA
jgi:two-component system NarL family sensor kinase